VLASSVKGAVWTPPRSMFVNSTDPDEGPHVREMVLAAGVYNIPVYPDNSTPGALNSSAGAESMSPLDLRRLEIDSQRDDASESPKMTRRSQPILFPSVEDVDSVHGQGTVAFELEREFATRNSTLSPQQARKSRVRPHIVISDLDSGIALSGICMAFASTGTYVFGAAPSEGFWDHAWSTHTPGQRLSLLGWYQASDVRHPLAYLHSARVSVWYLRSQQRANTCRKYHGTRPL
jgi:hypothetical protein